MRTKDPLDAQWIDPAHKARLKCARQREVEEIQAEYAKPYVLPPPMERPGVYFMYAPAVRTVKIGVTEKPVKRRLASISHASPVGVHLVALIPGAGYEVESGLHALLHMHRDRGEWFRLGARVIGAMHPHLLDGISVTAAPPEVHGV